MIYSSYYDALKAAEDLNKRLGHPAAYVVSTRHGWTVIAT